MSSVYNDLIFKLMTSIGWKLEYGLCPQKIAVYARKPRPDKLVYKIEDNHQIINWDKIYNRLESIFDTYMQTLKIHYNNGVRRLDLMICGDTTIYHLLERITCYFERESSGCDDYDDVHQEFSKILLNYLKENQNLPNEIKQKIDRIKKESYDITKGII